MTRVSENSSFNAINYSIGKTKEKLEDLQMKGSSLKRIRKPSDDPVGNVELMSIRSRNVDGEQYLRNISYAKSQLTIAESAVADLTEVLMRAKEIAIGQASTVYTEDVRKSVAEEVKQLRLHAQALGNKRVGNRYIFGGFKTLSTPFNNDGKYLGDDGVMKVEVNKGQFIPINIPGEKLFVGSSESLDEKIREDDIPKIPREQEADQPKEISRGLASVEEGEELYGKKDHQPSVFSDLESLENALLSDSTDVIQTVLEKLDDHINRVVLTRTKIGGLLNSISKNENSIEDEKIQNEEYKSRIEDADIAELFTDLKRNENVLRASYKASSNVMNQTLLDFIR